MENNCSGQSMPPPFRLFWLRETGCDAGTPLRADELPPEIRLSVLALVPGAATEVVLRLPYMDASECRCSADILAPLTWVRHGNEICAALPAQAALRDLAAQVALADPTWAEAPSGTDMSY